MLEFVPPPLEARTSFHHNRYDAKSLSTGLVSWLRRTLIVLSLLVASAGTASAFSAGGGAGAGQFVDLPGNSAPFFCDATGCVFLGGFAGYFVFVDETTGFIFVCPSAFAGGSYTGASGSAGATPFGFGCVSVDPTTQTVSSTSFIGNFYGSSIPGAFGFDTVTSAASASTASASASGSAALLTAIPLLASGGTAAASSGYAPGTTCVSGGGNVGVFVVFVIPFTCV